MYAIAYIPHGGDFAGQECAFWRSYGIPFRYATFAQAQEKINSIHYLPNLDARVVTAAVAERMTAEMVEVYSGRRKVQGFRRVVVDQSKATYARVMELLKPIIHKFPVETVATKPAFEMVAGMPSCVVLDE